MSQQDEPQNDNNHVKQQVVRAALALKKNLKVRFKDRTFEFPNIIHNRYIVGESLTQGGFGFLFDCQDSLTFQSLVIKFVSFLKSNLNLDSA